MEPVTATASNTADASTAASGTQKTLPNDESAEKHSQMLTVLKCGKHDNPEDGMCLMEAVAYVAGESHSDYPECCCPVIARFGRTWNDDMRSDTERERLLKWVPRLVGTRADRATEQRRSALVFEWLTRECLPAWLDVAELTGLANAVHTMTDIDLKTMDDVKAAARLAASTASVDMGVDVKAAVWLAGSNAAGAAANDAAKLAGSDAANAAVSEAARLAARTAARAVASVAARAVASAAARHIASAAASDVARAALEPTVTTLQDSADRLIERMIAA